MQDDGRAARAVVVWRPLFPPAKLRSALGAGALPHSLLACSFSRTGMDWTTVQVQLSSTGDCLQATSSTLSPAHSTVPSPSQIRTSDYTLCNSYSNCSLRLQRYVDTTSCSCIELTLLLLQISEAEELTALLKASLHASNAHLSYAALACLPAYFPLLVPTHSASADLSRALSSSTNASSPQRPVSPASSSATSHTSHAAHTLKHAFISLLPLDKLGDSKEKVRDTAREALVSAARTALRLGVNAGTGGSNKEGPWGYLETKVAEQGFHGKSAKARAQVRLAALPLM